MTSNAEITFGALPLLAPMSSGGDYQIDVCADGTEYGNPVATVAAVASMLMDGDRAQITRYGNREATLKLQIEGATLDVVAEATAAIEREVNKGRNTLTWLPPGWSTASVFDVVYSELNFDHDDLAELRVTRYFTLTLVCLPFARRAEPTITVAAPIPVGTPSHVVVDACTSLTGWSALKGTLSLSSGRVTGTGSPFVALERSGLSAAVAAAEFIVLDIDANISPASLQKALYDNTGAEIALGLKAVEQVTATRTRHYYSPTAPVTLGKIIILTNPAGSWTVRVHEIYLTDQLPVIGAGYQRSLIASLGGTARTTADIVVDMASGSTGGACLLYTVPMGGLPPSLRIWKSAGASATADVTCISGARNTFASPVEFTVPAGMLKPASYLMVAYMKGTAVSTIVGWAATTVGSYADTTTDQSGSITAVMPASYAFYELGIVTLPTIGVDPASNSSAKITLTCSVGATILDELLLYNLDDGELTWIKVVVGLPTKVEIRSATVDRDRPEWLVGTSGTDADNVSVAARVSPGNHELPPGETFCHLITPNSTTQTVTVEAYERFRHHVPPKAS